MMQNWEEYEADYYGNCPCERGQRGMRNTGRNWRPQAEDYADTRFRDEYGGGMWNRAERDELYPENRFFQNGREEAWDGGRFLGRRRSGRTAPGEMPEEIGMEDTPADDAVWKDMDEFESLYGELETGLMRIIRRICDTVDGDGCAAMEGQMSREMLEMLIDRVLETAREEESMGNAGDGIRMGDSRPVGETETDSTELLKTESVSMNDTDVLRRSLVSSLLFHELLRRRMRRRMNRRRRGDFRSRWRG